MSGKRPLLLWARGDEKPICHHFLQRRRSNTGSSTLITRIGFSDESLSPLLEHSRKHDNRQDLHIPYLRRCHNHNCANRHHRRTSRAVRRCAYGNRQHFGTDGRRDSHWLRSVFQTWACFHSSHNHRHRHCCTRWLNALARQQPTLPPATTLRHLWCGLYC